MSYYYNRKNAAEEEMSPCLYVLFAALAVILFVLLISRCDPEPLIAAEKSYNDQRYAKGLNEQQAAAIAASLRRVAKEKAIRYLTAEDEALEGFWPGTGRRK